MTEKPILFSGPMVRAILEGRKTQTRRVLKRQPELRGPDYMSVTYERGGERFGGPPDYMLKVMADFGCKHRRGDRLWVREAHAIVGKVDPGFVLYRASGYEEECARLKLENCPPESDVRWRPSIHMPRWASRITLEVTDVRVQRLRDISEEDAIAEGVEMVRYSGDNPKYLNDYGWKDYSDHPHAVAPFASAKLSFESLWQSINGADSWGSNPFVAAYTFKVVPQ